MLASWGWRIIQDEEETSISEVKSSGISFSEAAYRSCLQRGPWLAAKHDNVLKSLRCYWFWRYEGAMEKDWCLAPCCRFSVTEERPGDHWWRCSLWSPYHMGNDHQGQQQPWSRDSLSLWDSVYFRLAEPEEWFCPNSLAPRMIPRHSLSTGLCITVELWFCFNLTVAVPWFFSLWVIKYVAYFLFETIPQLRDFELLH